MNIKLEKIRALFFENNKAVIKECDIYIEGDKISSINKEPQGFIPEKVIKGRKKLVIPGLINTHTHSYMSIFRNIADDLSFSDWLFGRISPLEDKLTPTDMYWGAKLAFIEMIKTGTTCFVDMTMAIEDILEAVSQTGIRAVLSRGLVGEGNNDGGKIRLDEFFRAYNSCKDENISFLLGPHAPYTCDCEYLKTVTDLAKKNNLGITIHLSESLTEIENVKKEHGMSPIELMDSVGLFSVPTIAAHCVHLSNNDISILKNKNVSVATNPKSNLKLANGVAPLVKMQNSGVNITIGTDGAASNNTLNMFSEMNYTAMLHKGINQNPTVMCASDILSFATLNAKKAINNPQIGEIKEGMKADLSILDIDTPQFYPENNLVSALVYSANGSEVETVIVNGKILMENRELKTIDTEKVYAECERIIERIDR